MMGPDSKLPENPLAISWHDSNWIPVLTPHNVMDYFSESSNPFYERTCNNEVLKMQRASMDQLQNMTGVEFCLLHVQDPILYVIRKQHRRSPTQVTPLADYYIIAGTVYQAPDLGSVLNSRLVSSVNHLQQAFEEARNYATYHPSRGYWWDFEKGKKRKGAPGVPGGGAFAASDASANTKDENAKKKKKSSSKSKLREVEKRGRDEPSSLFQRHRVDMLLDLLTKRFPPKNPSAAPSVAGQASSTSGAAAADGSTSDPAKPDGKEGEVQAKSEKAIKTEPTTSASTAVGIKREATPMSASAAKKAKM